MGGACTYQPSSWLLAWPAHWVAERVRGEPKELVLPLVAVMGCQSPALQSWSSSDCPELSVDLASGLLLLAAPSVFSCAPCRLGSGPKEGEGRPNLEGFGP